MFDFDELERSCVHIGIKTPLGNYEGTGSLIYNESEDGKVILTCGHNVEDFFDMAGNVVTFTVTLGGKTLPAYVVSSEEDCRAEVGILVTEYEGRLPCKVLDISCPLEVKGMPIFMSSYATGSEKISNSTGNLSQPRVEGVEYALTNVPNVVEYVIPTNEGSSGAAVVDCQGRLVAVHVGARVIYLDCGSDDVISKWGLTFNGCFTYGIPSEMVRVIIEKMSSILDEEATRKRNSNNESLIPKVSLNERLKHISRMEGVFPNQKA